MSLAKYSIVGICLISGVIGVTSYYNLSKVEESMQKDVSKWNTQLPEGFKIRLNNSVHFSGAEGAYIISNEQDGKAIDIITLNFTSKFNLLTLIIPNSKLPIKGTGSLDIEKLNTENIQYSLNKDGKNFIKFDGFIEKDGNFKINYTQEAYLLGMITQNEDDTNQLYLNIDSNKGSFSKKNYNFDFSSLIPKIEMLDTPEQKDGIAIAGVNTSLQFTQDNDSVKATFNSAIDSIQDMATTPLFNIKGINTTLGLNEDSKNFTHQVKLHIQSANTEDQKDVSMNLDYDMSVPVESKSAIISILSSQQDSDYIEKQENAFKLFKSGFNFNLNKFQFNQGKDSGNIIFKINLKPQENNTLLSDRVSFNGQLSFDGSSVAMIQTIIPIPLDELNAEKGNPEKLKISFDYKKSQLTLNENKAEKVTEETLVKSLVGLDIMMKEAEEELTREKENIEANHQTSADNHVEDTKEIPGTEEKPLNSIQLVETSPSAIIKQ